MTMQCVRTLWATDDRETLARVGWESRFRNVAYGLGLRRVRLLRSSRTEDLLSGRVAAGGCHVSEQVWEDDVTKMDVQSHEISRWVDGALKGNLNYMIGILSPLPLDDPRGFLLELRRLVESNPSTAMVPSTLGIARSTSRRWRRI